MGHMNQQAVGRQLLKVESQRKLYHPAAAVPVGLPEGAVNLLPRRVESRGGIYARKLRVIECVVELTAKLKLQVLMQGEILESGQIGLILPRSSKNNPASVSNVPQRGLREHARIEKAVPVSSSESELRITREVDPLSIAASDDIRAALKREADPGGRAAGESQGCGYVPVPQHGFDNWIRQAI